MEGVRNCDELEHWKERVVDAVKYFDSAEPLMTYGELLEHIHRNKVDRSYDGVNIIRLKDLESTLLIRFDEKRGYYRLTNNGKEYLDEYRKKVRREKHGNGFARRWRWW